MGTTNQTRKYNTTQHNTQPNNRQHGPYETNRTEINRGESTPQTISDQGGTQKCPGGGGQKTPPVPSGNRGLTRDSEISKIDRFVDSESPLSTARPGSRPRFQIGFTVPIDGGPRLARSGRSVFGRLV